MEPRQFIVQNGEKGERLDKWLARKMPNLSRGQIKHLLDQGKVLVNHRRILIAGWELEAEDSVEVRMPMGGIPDIKETAEGPRDHGSGSGGQGQRTTDHGLRTRDQGSGSRDRGQRTTDRPAVPRMEDRPAPSNDRPDRGGRRFLEVLFEDRDIIVVDKPAGVLTEPKGDSPHDHLLGMIKGYLKRKFKESRGSYVKLLHRLDRDTSGAVVAAKSKVGEQLESQFRSHRIERNYVALVEGRIDKEEAKIDFPIEKGDFEGGRKSRVAKKGEGMPATTHYRVRERYERATLLDIRVETGRTHQVRVHLSELGHPLVGDKTYGAVQIPFSRHALHASQLGFKHPRTGQYQKFESKLPQDMNNLIDKLRGG